MALELIKGKELIPERNVGSSLFRNIARLGTRLGETVIGTIGEAFTPTEQKISQLASLISGQQTTPKITPQSIRQNISSQAGQYLEPQNFTEEILDSLVQDLPYAVAFNPKNIIKTLGKSAIGNIAALGTREVGGGPVAQTLSNIGARYFTGKLLREPGMFKQIENIKEESYKKADKALEGKNDYQNAKPLKDQINDLGTKVLLGDSPAKDYILERINAINEAIDQNDNITPKHAWELKKNINEHLRTKSPESADPYLKQLNGYLKQTLDQYGKKNPIFKENLDLSDELHGSFAKANEAQKFIKEHLTTKQWLAKPWTSTFFYGFQKGKQHLIGRSSLLWNSPQARKLAGEIYIDAFAKNSRMLDKHLSQLDKFVTHHEKNYGLKPLELISGNELR